MIAMGISSISVVSVPVTDQDRAKEFYETLGFRVINDHVMGPDEMPPEPDQRWLQMAAPDGGTTIVLVTWQVGRLEPGDQHLAVSCKDLEAVRRDLTAAGYEVTPNIPAPFGTFFSSTDPDGNGLLVVEAAAES